MWPDNKKEERKKSLIIFLCSLSQHCGSSLFESTMSERNRKKNVTAWLIIHCYLAVTYRQTVNGPRRVSSFNFFLSNMVAFPCSLNAWPPCWWKKLYASTLWLTVNIGEPEDAYKGTYFIFSFSYSHIPGPYIFFYFFIFYLDGPGIVWEYGAPRKRKWIPVSHIVCHYILGSRIMSVSVLEPRMAHRRMAHNLWEEQRFIHFLFTLIGPHQQKDRRLMAVQ